jgi:hypothetical protein
VRPIKSHARPIKSPVRFTKSHAPTQNDSYKTYFMSALWRNPQAFVGFFIRETTTPLRSIAIQEISFTPLQAPHMPLGAFQEIMCHGRANVILN